MTKRKSQSVGRMVSPNELHAAAKDCYLDGRDPVTHEDWQYCVNFWAANVALAEVECCIIMSRIFDCPLPKPEITEIAKFQQNLKREGK